MPDSGAAITSVQMTTLPAPCAHAQLSIPVSYLWFCAALFPHLFAPGLRPAQCGAPWATVSGLCSSAAKVRQWCHSLPLSPLPRPPLRPAWAALRWAPTWGPPHTPVSVGPPPSSIVNSAATAIAHIPQSRTAPSHAGGCLPSVKPSQGYKWGSLVIPFDTNYQFPAGLLCTFTSHGCGVL